MRQFLIVVVMLCWSTPSLAIIEGLQANVESFRSYVSIRQISPYPSHNGQELNACGGTLVAPNLVLTALHCRGSFDVAVSGGEPVFVGVNLQSDGTFGAKLRVVDVLFAPVPLGSERLDAALLKLESDATEYGAEVANLFEGDLIVGTSTTTVGIGQGLEGTSLEYYDSRIAEPELCDTTRGDFDVAHDFCVGVPGSTQRTGYGDSGGPLYILENGPDAQYLFAGIVKGGVKAGPSGPEETENIRYTDVRKVRDWIDDITRCYDASIGSSTSAGNITTCGDTSSDASLTDTYWRIDKLFDHDVIVTNNRREPHLVLRGDGQNTVNATVGCNRISASFAHNGPDLTFGQGISTRMACLPPLDQLEQQLILLLEKVESFRIAGDSMVFLGSGGNVTANLTAVYLP